MAPRKPAKIPGPSPTFIAYAKYAGKAITATGIAFSGALGVALSDGHGVTGVEWTAIATTTLLAAAGVFGIQNGPNPKP